MKPTIDIRRLTWDDCQEWDTFVRGSYNGTLFHEMQFLGYHPKGRFDFQFLGFYEQKNRLIGVLPYVIENGIIKSPVGSSFGGFVLAPVSFSKIHDVVQHFVVWATEKNIRKIHFTHAPLVYNKMLCQDLEFVLHYNAFKNDYNQFSSVLDLTWFDASKDPFANLSSAGRRAVRKSFSEGVVVQESNDIEQYYPILEKNKAKFGVTPAHTLDELYLLKEIYPDHFKLFAAYYKNEMVGGVYTFHCNDDVLMTFYIASLDTYQAVRPINRVLYDVAIWSAKRDYRYLDLGVSMNTKSDNPMEPAWSLVSFKEHIGTRGFLRPSFSWVNNSLEQSDI